MKLGLRLEGPVRPAADLDQLVDSDEMVFDAQTAADCDHFGDINEMVLGPLADFLEGGDFLAHGFTFHDGCDQNTATGQAAANLRTSICPVTAAEMRAVRRS